jgi:hypothetical protein
VRHLGINLHNHGSEGGSTVICVESAVFDVAILNEGGLFQVTRCVADFGVSNVDICV